MCRVVTEAEILEAIKRMKSIGLKFCLKKRNEWKVEYRGNSAVLN